MARGQEVPMYVLSSFSSLTLSPCLSLCTVDHPTLLSSSLPTPITPLPPVEDANISTGPSAHPSYPLPPIRNDMYPRRPSNSLRLVITPLQLKSTSYKYFVGTQDFRQFVYDSFWKKGDGWYEGSGMVGFVEEG